MPAAGEEARAAGLELQHGGADGLEKPAVVRDQRDRSVEADECLLEPLEGLDVEVVRRLVEQQQVRADRERASERRARELAAGERVQAAVEIGLGEPQPARHHGRAIAPQIAAAGLEPGLRARVAVERLLVGLAGGHALLERGELRLDLQLLGAAGEDVVAQRHRALARRALIVQSDARALGEAETAPVDRLFAGEHPQQRGLARAVAPGDRHPLAALELERDAAQQRAPGDVLVQVGCDDHGHRRHGRRGLR